MPHEIKFKKWKERYCKYKGKKSKLVEIKKGANFGVFGMDWGRPIDSKLATKKTFAYVSIFGVSESYNGALLFPIFLTLPKG